MDTKVLKAMEYFNLPDEKVVSHAQNIQKFLENLFETGSIKNFPELQQAIITLHSFRKRYPQKESEINKILFDLHKKSLSATDSDITQGMSIPFFLGFEQHPVSNAEDVKKLIQAISETPNQKYLTAMIERLTASIAYSYEKKYMAQDSDKSLARMLRDYVAFSYWRRKSKNNAFNSRWAHEVTQTLANIYPTDEFQNTANQFPDIPTRSVSNKILKNMPKEATVIYPGKSQFSFNHFPKGYEKE